MAGMDMPLSDLIPPLTSHDRCDTRGCNAQARVAVLLTFETQYPLLFCLHHSRDALPRIEHPFAVRDQSSELAPSPGPG